jgi:protein-disulfide isomerase
MITFMSRCLTLAAALTLTVLASAGCSSTAQQNGAAAGDVVARVGDREITLAEVEKRWESQDPAAHAEAVQKLYDGRREAIDAFVAELLFAEAAEGKGLSPAAYEEAELSRRARQVTDADVTSFYQANIGEMQGRPLQEMAPLINRFLQDQFRASARQELIAELRSSGTPVEVLLDAPRRTVAVDAADPARGSASAAVTIVEFSDFQCPYCQRVSPTLKRLQETYGDKVRIVWKDFPLTQIHPEAFKAAEAAHCAGDQGKFWDYHDRLFANQQALAAGDLKRYASDMSLDMAQFNACLDTSKHAERVRSGVEAGNRLGVSSTPTIYINGRALSGAYPYETFVSIVDEELERLE